MLNLFILIIAAALMAALLFFERMNNWKKVLPIKTLLSCLFMLAAIVQPHPHTGYYGLILLGLLFCLGGDVFLALPRKIMFLLGLVSFLIGHVFYVAAFINFAGMNGFALAGTLITIAASASVYKWLKPHLGTMQKPVICYIIVISGMLCGAFAILGEKELAVEGRGLVIIGAFSFYLSDLFVARNRFLKDEFLNRLLGLPLYYAGQFMLAFSVGVLP